jgi:TolB-like protein/Flp pilus assembly protein TadD
MSTTSRAVFLSYASEDASAAQRFAEALRAAGIDVWFDQSELRGGDAWDRQIRERIHDCRLFIALISAHTEARDEGYFRREWKLAVDRTHDMLEKKAFLLPVAIDATPERGAAVPDKFHEVQWTRLPGGEAPPEFVARIKRLLSPDSPTAPRLPVGAASGSSPVPRTTGPPLALKRAFSIAVTVLVLAALTHLLINKPWIPKPAAPPAASNVTSSPGAPTAAFSPPPHSIAVLPFADLSEKHDQEYFSDGLSEELINRLTKLPDLRVTSRTSSFFFKNRSEDLATIAQKLRVAHLLEGSVRKSGHSIRVSAQLIKADGGYDVWSQTYDRDLKDVFQVQDEIAGQVAQAMKVALSSSQPDTQAKESNLTAYNQFLLGKFYFERHTQGDMVKAIDYLRKAIELDRGYARAWSALSMAYLWQWGFGWAPLAEASAKWREAVEQAIKIDPNLAHAHSSLALGLMWFDADWKGALRELERTRELDPTNVNLLIESAMVDHSFGHFDEAIDLYRQDLERDPLSTVTMMWLSATLYMAGRLDESAATSRQLLQLNPGHAGAHAALGLTYLGQGRKEDALAEIEKESDVASKLFGEARVFHALGRQTESNAALKELEDKFADGSSYEIASLYADRGETDAAFKWLERAHRQRDSSLTDLKVDPDMRGLRQDPRFHTLLVKLNLAGDKPE